MTDTWEFPNETYLISGTVIVFDYSKAISYKKTQIDTFKEDRRFRLNQDFLQVFRDGSLKKMEILR